MKSLKHKIIVNSLVALISVAAAIQAQAASSYEHKGIGQFIVQNNIDCKRDESGSFVCRSFKRKNNKKVKEELALIEPEIRSVASDIQEAKLKLDPKSKTYETDKKALELKKKSLTKLKRYRGNLYKLSYAIKDKRAQEQEAANQEASDSKKEEKSKEVKSKENSISAQPVLEKLLPLGELLTGE